MSYSAKKGPLWSKVHELQLSDHDILKSLKGGAEDFRHYLGREPNATSGPSNATGLDRIKAKAKKHLSEVSHPATSQDGDDHVSMKLPSPTKTKLTSFDDIRQRLNELENEHMAAMSKSGASDHDDDDND